MLGVYAVTTADAGRIALAGMTGERLRVVRVKALAAIVGDMARRPRPTEPNLRHYDGVIQALAARLPALLPARFGTHVRDQAELILILQSRQASLTQNLARLRNRVQMTVRMVSPDVGPAVSGSPGGPDKAPTGAVLTGAEFLRARAQAHQVPGFQPAREAVQRWVRDERVERRGAVASVYHLVPRLSAAAYRRALERAAANADIRLVVSGPFPAYAFADGW